MQQLAKLKRDDAIKDKTNSPTKVPAYHTIKKSMFSMLIQTFEQ
jgi:hypothetical protein